MEGGEELASKSVGSRYDRISELGETGLWMCCSGMEGRRVGGHWWEVWQDSGIATIS